MDKITESMKEHYSKTFDEFGANVQGVDWGGADDTPKLALRYSKMLEVIDRVYENGSNDISVLDVGCGYGGLYDYAIEKGYMLEYTGIDTCDNMIQYASGHYPEGTFVCGNVLEYELPQKYTFVICNGILTQKLEASIKEMDKYARALIQKMWDLSTKGVVFNIMKSQVDFMKETLYYKSPLEIMAYCMTLTDKFVIDSSYPLYEYTVYLYKK